MAEIFKEAQVFNNHPERWNHDWSHKSYGSYKMGVIYPVMTELLEPTQTIKVDMAALLQFMPTPTPLQSNVRVIFHAFFQRMKNIHEDWTNTIEQLEEHELPYVLPSVSEFVPGSIHDFLGVPCVSVQHGTQKLPAMYSFSAVYGLLDDPSGKFCLFGVNDEFVQKVVYGWTFSTVPSEKYGIGLFDYGSKVLPAISSISGVGEVFKVHLSQYPFKVVGSVLSDIVLRLRVSNSFGFSISSDYRIISASAHGTNYRDGEPFFVAFSSSEVLSALDSLGYENGMVVHFDLVFHWPTDSDETKLDPCSFEDFTIKSTVFDVLTGENSFVYFTSGSFALADFPLMCPYATKEFPDAPIRLRAYRYRTYESVYNAFYRNLHGNQPFIVDGVTQYNKYNTTKASGPDATNYHLFNRNWELDAYTSALPSPQQGNPPVIGITATGRLSVQDDDGTRSTAQLYDLPDGQQGLSISQINAANDTHRNIIMSLASSGFTINDLRDGNALTKFLETNIRKGFRYVDFIMGHFGKAPSHAEMDMPEFVGGFTVKLDVGKVTNTNAAASSDNPNDVLGQFAGSAQAFGGSKHSLQYYADDYGYFMITMCIVPDSAYSQILPKDFLYSQPLDFPFPEFTHLGYQPITYEEFCPVEAYKDQLASADSDNPLLITDVFGYQRPQYERVWKPDTLHGQFLTTMNNYVISRFFSGRPELGNDFFTIKPEETQNVFSVTKADNDICFGQISFAVTVKQPVPRISIPSIGR